MTLLTILEGTSVNDGIKNQEFNKLLLELTPIITSYTEHKQKAQLDRMKIIGLIWDYKKQFPQRSGEHKSLNKAMTDEGWSKDVIHNNIQAYKTYRQILDHSHSDFHPVAKKATVTQLQLIGREDVSLYHLLKYLRRNKKLPPVSAIRGYLAGYFTEEFESKSKHRNGSGGLSSSSSGSSKLKVREEPSFESGDEYIGHSQSYVREQYLYFLDQLDMNECFVNDEFKEELKQDERHRKQELLEDWSRTRTSRLRHFISN